MPELKGFYFDAMTNNQAEAFMRIRKENLEFIAQKSSIGFRVKKSLEEGSIQLPDKPVPPEDQAATVAVGIYHEKLKLWVKTEAEVVKELKQAYSIIFEQCTPVMIQKLESNQNYLTLAEQHNAIRLLKIIKNINFKFKDQTYVHENIFMSLQRLFNYSKTPEDEIVKHFDKLKNRSKIVEQFGDLGNTKIIQKADPNIAAKVEDMHGTAGNVLITLKDELQKLNNKKRKYSKHI